MGCAFTSPHTASIGTAISADGGGYACLGICFREFVLHLYVDNKCMWTTKHVWEFDIRFCLVSYSSVVVVGVANVMVASVSFHFLAIQSDTGHGCKVSMVWFEMWHV